MTADRARISYDRSRDYRMLVKQQGRVTLEADDNEAAVIASEALRLETIDVIGPVDDGVIGMLIALVRAAQSRGARLVLDRAPKRMRAQFEAAGLAHRFDWRG